MPYNDDMKCDVDSITYDPAKQIVTVKSPANSVPDMRAGTSAITKRYPDVLRIEHWQADRLSTVYSREYGTWKRRYDQEQQH